MRSTAPGLAGALSAFGTGVPATDHTQNFPNPYLGHAEVVPSGIHKLGGPLHVPPVGRAESYAGEQTQPCTGCDWRRRGEERLQLHRRIQQ